MFAPVGKSGPLTCSIRSSTVQSGLFDQRDRGVDHLTEVVWRDVRRHPDRDPGGAVDEQVGERRRQHLGLFEPVVVVRRKIDRVAFDVG